jgi:hypothetical protein
MIRSPAPTGAKIAGHRGYFLTNDGIDLNQALISYGLDFLRKRGYKKIMPPFFMNKDQMAKTAQLDQFDDELYKVLFRTAPAVPGDPDGPAGHRRGRRKVPDRDLGAAHLRLPLRGVVREAGGAAPGQVRGLLDVLPQGGRLGRPRHVGHLPRAPVREGRAVLHH